MGQIRVENFAELHQALMKFGMTSLLSMWMFRGQANVEWGVLPRAGRDGFSLGNDLARFRAWCEAAVAYTDLPDNEWECLAIAQHHGLATRLLDWTTNPLVAAFFAVKSEPKSDGAVYAFVPRSFVTPKTMSLDDRYLSVYGYNPRPINKRLAVQSGRFTVHLDPQTPLSENHADAVTFNELHKIVIPASAKIGLQKELNRYGVNQMTLFPDLDGLSSFIDWNTQLSSGDRMRNSAMACDKTSE